MKIELTDKEMNFVAYFMETEYGEGCGYVFFEEWDMKKTRGVMSSLVKKGVITHIDEDWRSMGAEYPMSWICLNGEQLETYGKLLDEADIKWRW